MTFIGGIVINILSKSGFIVVGLLSLAENIKIPITINTTTVKTDDIIKIQFIIYCI
jgi:hypothetical protein